MASLTKEVVSEPLVVGDEGRLLLADWANAGSGEKKRSHRTIIFPFDAPG
jgi:hypothetical protein